MGTIKETLFVRKILILFILLTSVFSFATVYYQIDEEEIEKINTLENAIARQFVIPRDALLTNPETMYFLICQAAAESDVNIFRRSLVYKEDDQVEILKYLLLTRDTRFFDSLRLKNGRFFEPEETQYNGSFISTINTGEQTQIGVLSDFGGNHLITLRPLKSSYERFSVEGPYFVEAANDADVQKFIHTLVDSINEYYKPYLRESNFSYKDFTPSSKAVEVDGTANKGTGIEALWGGGLGTVLFNPSVDLFNFINRLILIIVLILMLYYIFNESKRIGIMKMHGVAKFRLWFIIAGRLIVILFVLTTLAALAAGLWTSNTSLQFLRGILLNQFKSYAVMLFLSMAAYLYISRIAVGNAIKNRKDANSIFALNSLLKIGCSVLLVLYCFAIWNQFGVIRTKQERLKNWEFSKDYGVIQNFFVGYDEDISSANAAQSSVRDDLYRYLNQRGALLINAFMYDQKWIIRNKNWNGVRSIKVNPNYLTRFPLYDQHQNPVQIAEDCSDWILLVPEKYRAHETEILDFFHKDRFGAEGYEGWHQGEERNFHRTVPEQIKNQQIKIIWLADNQKVFSFDPDVFPAEKNLIIDPIIQVVTEQNSLLIDRDAILGTGASDPLKIRLIERDSVMTYQSLLPELKRLKLDDNLKSIVTVDQFVLQEINRLQEALNQLIMVSLGLLAGLLFLVIQNLAIFFNKYRYRFIVRRLFGTGFFKTYKEYLWIFCGGWAVQILLCGILSYKNSVGLMSIGVVQKAFDYGSAAIIGGIIAFELLASAIALITIERRNKLNVLKEGV